MESDDNVEEYKYLNFKRNCLKSLLRLYKFIHEKPELGLIESLGKQINTLNEHLTQTDRKLYFLSDEDVSQDIKNEVENLDTNTISPEKSNNNNWAFHQAIVTGTEVLAVALSPANQGSKSQQLIIFTLEFLRLYQLYDDGWIPLNSIQFQEEIIEELSHRLKNDFPKKNQLIYSEFLQDNICAAIFPTGSASKLYFYKTNQGLDILNCFDLPTDIICASFVSLPEYDSRIVDSIILIIYRDAAPVFQLKFQVFFHNSLEVTSLIKSCFDLPVDLPHFSIPYLTSQHFSSQIYASPCNSNSLILLSIGIAMNAEKYDKTIIYLRQASVSPTDLKIVEEDNTFTFNLPWSTVPFFLNPNFISQNLTGEFSKQIKLNHHLPIPLLLQPKYSLKNGFICLLIPINKTMNEIDLTELSDIISLCGTKRLKWLAKIELFENSNDFVPIYSYLPYILFEPIGELFPKQLLLIDVSDQSTYRFETLIKSSITRINQNYCVLPSSLDSFLLIFNHN